MKLEYLVYARRFFRTIQNFKHESCLLSRRNPAFSTLWFPDFFSSWSYILWRAVFLYHVLSILTSPLYVPLFHLSLPPSDRTTPTIPSRPAANPQLPSPSPISAPAPAWPYRSYVLLNISLRNVASQSYFETTRFAVGGLTASRPSLKMAMRISISHLEYPLTENTMRRWQPQMTRGSSDDAGGSER